MKIRKSFLPALLLSTLLLILVISPVIAQTPEEPLYRLNLSRDFGYGAGADIKGLFSLRIVGPEDLTSVSFFIDGELMSKVDAAPFKYQFNTSQYPFGWHDLTAQGINAAGDVFTTPARHMNFVSAAEESAGTKKVIIPILSLTLGIVVIITLGQFLVFRKQKPTGLEAGSHRNYGFAGGAICKQCGRPTPRHMWGINLGFGKLDRCENCGKWSLMRIASMDDLRAAEAAEKDHAFDKPAFNESSEEEKLKEMIEKSKYE